jgi:hypothetical protein
MSIQVRELRKSKLRFPLEVIANEWYWLLDGLNGVPEARVPEANRKRLELLIEEMKIFDAARRECERSLVKAKSLGSGYTRYWPDCEFENEVTQQANLSGKASSSRLNKLLARYRSAPVLVVNGLWDYAVSTSNEDSLSDANYDERLSAYLLIDELREGRIERFRRCEECTKWFFAVTIHQKFCSDNCRKKYASKSDEYRRKRAIFMRKYRKQQKAMNESMKALAKKH